ncbi:MAG: class I SAM-dependent rRNA methyltransferase [Lachnospiraceae bacterium]|nr:class I SAM-dependent rRNA methyltransferase [Lachnospiraceae bacterium]
MTNDRTIVVSDAVVILKKGGGRLLKSGGAWIFDNEIGRIDGSFENGDIVAVNDFDGYFLGWGYINTKSKITVRILSRNVEEPVTEDLLERRVREAWNYRKEVIDTSSCRLIFGEADFLPGFTIDKFEDVLVIESLTLGADRLKLIVLDICKKVLAEDGVKIRGIYERSDAKVREKEGLKRLKGFIGDEFDTKVQIVENGVKYYVDVENGQKTGFFLDQKNNRAAIARFCKDKTVLDCFTHTGSFALNAGAAGAKSVHAVDASDLAIAQAEENAKLNGLENTVSFEVADVFDLLPKLEAEKKKYDVVILDPPAFTKNRASIKNAVKGYREINIRGMKLVKNGGFLATCSCSHFMDPELFTKTIGEAARDAHKRLRQVEFRTQAPDHPILWSADESYYLKFYIFQVVDEKL